MSAENITKGAPDGTSFGQSTTDKISFYGVATVSQLSAAAQAAVVSSGAVAISSGFGFTTSAELNNLVALANALRSALVSLGLIKGS